MLRRIMSGLTGMLLDFDTIDGRELQEEELPCFWKQKNIFNFALESLFFHERKTIPSYSVMIESINELARELILEHSAGSVLDMGVGEGIRLAEICSGLDIDMYGIDLSEACLQSAEEKGIITKRADLTSETGFTGLDMVLYLSCDFGYCIDRREGHLMRVQALDRAYESLNQGGLLFMELPYISENEMFVAEYKRRLSLKWNPKIHFDCLTHYLGCFSSGYVQDLISESKFTNPVFSFVVKQDTDKYRAGEVHLAPEENIQYRLIVQLEKN